MLISEEYRWLNSELHSRLDCWGGFSSDALSKVKYLIKTCEAQSVLDYGCGKGELSNILGSIVANYDPAIDEYVAEPDPADLVICMSVLEHIEPECLEAVLDHLASLAIKTVFLGVATVISSHVLADGRNSHLIVEAPEWWVPRLISRWDFQDGEIEPKGFWFVGKSKEIGRCQALTT